jgi:eukaryotic-like serine/threonine-protein kinase
MTVEGRYHVGEILRETGRTTVFDALDARVGTRLELEVLTADDDAWSPSARALELRAAMNAEIAHPAVPLPRDVGLLEDGSPYVVRPRREGHTLEDRVCLGGPLAVADVIRVGLDLLSALAAAHEKGLKHGAVAPEHIVVVERDGLILGAKLDGFGCEAPKVDDHSTLGFSHLAFVAPERLDAATSTASAPSPASDLFALAACVHFAATGTSPSTARRGAGPFGIVPARLSRALLRAMHPEPAHRYASAQEMIGMLLTLRDLPPGEMVDDIVPATRPGRPTDGRFLREENAEHTATITSTDIRRIAEAAANRPAKVG